MEKMFAEIMRFIDPVLIVPFRIVDEPLMGFFLGVFILGLLAVAVGDLTLSGAIRFNRRYLQDLTHTISHMEALSIQAYAAGDRHSYKALNQESNDAWGRYFFTMAAYSAGMLWPVPFALGWMQTRFQGVEFELVWPLNLLIADSVGYPFIFIPLYILARIVFKYLRPWLPCFRGAQAMRERKAEQGAG